MKPQERQKLREQYAKFADEQILEMLQDGPGAFIEGAYSILKEEAGKRGISLSEAAEPAAPEPEPAVSSITPQEVPVEETVYAEIAVINSQNDLNAAKVLLEPTHFNYYFQNMSIARKDFPVALLVDQNQVGQVITALDSFKPSSSILFW